MMTVGNLKTGAAMLTAALAGLGGLAATPLAAQQADASSYGCRDLTSAKPMAFLEGEGGVFYRLNLDMRMNHPFSERAAASVKALSDALAAKGTTLVYLPVPTKSLAMPDELPPAAASFGYDGAVARKAYRAFIDRFREVGVPVVDTATAMRGAEGPEPPFVATDFHWSSTGARAVAGQVAETLAALPVHEDMAKTDHVTRKTETDKLASAMRRRIQPYCSDSIPQAETQGFVTEATSDSGGSTEGGIFADAESAPPISLVGTSMSAEPAFNFEGFLAEAAGAEVANYAITGGNQFGSITSYLLSADFRDAPPDVLIWENPIYNNLGEFGELPWLELIAAVQDSCEPVETTISDDGTLSAQLSTDALGPDVSIRADSGDANGRQASFRFRTEEGFAVDSTITRPDRYEPTRWFYQALAPLQRSDFTRVEVGFDQPATDDATIALCNMKDPQT
ncbi:alginate O-acetyltransferase AlgX-related protein [Salipiger mucosus]|uniref:AlgX/AlgJ SGNH hydrolase-like domain-containing protein n=1 Tax=Salipiger mucosus DSM 16094 TaxID=1123237 RepID=S9S735_9RHOB|nr:hypothetical protein [Salipiger mucosus]EPX86005.1 hypothetical protein Salmuc_00821 [Salipiger mucosus DSM 16094]